MFWRLLLLLLLLRRRLAVVCGSVIGLTKLPFPAATCVSCRRMLADLSFLMWQRFLGSNPDCARRAVAITKTRCGDTCGREGAGDISLHARPTYAVRRCRAR